MKKTTILASAITLTAALIAILSLLLVRDCKRRGHTMEGLVEGRNRVLRESAALDKAYIPALVLTNQGKVEQSQKAMTRLKEVWETYANKYYPLVPRDREFRRSLDKIQNAIRTADHIVNSGGDLADAHEALEEIRFTFMALRKGRLTSSMIRWKERGELEWNEVWLPDYYYIDYLNEFHEPMEAIVLTAKGKTPETLTDEDVAKIKEYLAEASELLDKIYGAEFEQSVFDFSDEKAQTIRDYIDQETESLYRLRNALDDEDKEAIIQSSMGIKPGFVKLFTMFGDFESLK